MCWLVVYLTYVRMVAHRGLREYLYRAGIFHIFYLQRAIGPDTEEPLTWPLRALTALWRESLHAEYQLFVARWATSLNRSYNLGLCKCAFCATPPPPYLNDISEECPCLQPPVEYQTQQQFQVRQDQPPVEHQTQQLFQNRQDLPPDLNQPQPEELEPLPFQVQQGQMPLPIPASLVPKLEGPEMAGSSSHPSTSGSEFGPAYQPEYQVEPLEGIRLLIKAIRRTDNV